MKTKQEVEKMLESHTSSKLNKESFKTLLKSKEGTTEDYWKGYQDGVTEGFKLVLDDDTKKVDCINEEEIAKENVDDLIEVVKGEFDVIRIYRYWNEKDDDYGHGFTTREIEQDEIGNVLALLEVVKQRLIEQYDEGLE